MVAITMPEPRKPFSFPAVPDGEVQMREERRVAFDRDAIRGGLPDAVDAGAPTKIPATFKE
jgi:hypothetical protein